MMEMEFEFGSYGSAEMPQREEERGVARPEAREGEPGTEVRKLLLFVEEDMNGG
jgi:hypothetical protein